MNRRNWLILDLELSRKPSGDGPAWLIWYGVGEGDRTPDLMLAGRYTAAESTPLWGKGTILAVPLDVALGLRLDICVVESRYLGRFLESKEEKE